MMVPEQRRGAILELARQQSELKVDDIASRFGVSRETVRRDLAQLDALGLLRRVHGGAQKPQTAAEAPFRERLIENADAKERIARRAARLFQDDDTLMIDTGSTTQALARELAQRRLMVITNSVWVAQNLYGPGSLARVHLVGGEYRGETGEILGSVALDQIRQYRADHAILTVGAVDASGGFMDFDVEEAMVARAMIRQSEQVTVIADHSKFGRVAMAQVCALDGVSRLVTDRPPDPVMTAALSGSGVEVHIAD
jgi:DeoR family transcriptional regulator, glycerol-3-phosphate regulon repressor